MSRKVKCCLCLRWLGACRRLSSTSHVWFHQYLRTNGMSFDEDELHLCGSCVSKYYSLKSVHNVESTGELMDTTDDIDSQAEEPNITLENVLFSGSGHKCCVICRAKVSVGMIIMPKDARLDLLLNHSMYAPAGVRCCPNHLFNSCRLKPDVTIAMENRPLLSATFSLVDMGDIVTDLLGLVQAARTSPRLNFNDPSLSDEDYLAWTGWSKDQFDDMHNLVSPYLRSSSNRNTRDALAIFWIKLKTNLSFRQIGSIFNVQGDSEQRRKRMGDTFDSVRLALVNHFVPLHLGVHHLSREEARKNNTSFSIEFFGDNVTLIWDGTYIYIGKSSSNQMNRQTYSGQK